MCVLTRLTVCKPVHLTQAIMNHRMLSHGMLLQAPAGAYRSTSWPEPGAVGPEEPSVLPASAEAQLGKAAGGQQPWRSQVPTLLSPVNAHA